MSKKSIKFPSLENVIYKATSMDQIWNDYIETLRKSRSTSCNLYANKLQECYEMKESEKLKELEQEFYCLKELLRNSENNLGMHVRLTKRQKDFIGLNEKIRLYLKDGKPLERVRDLLGFRVVLCSGKYDTIETIMAAYNIMNMIISFFVKERNCLLAEAEPLLDLGFNKIEHPAIIVPEKSYILDGFENNVKDYIFHPKKNGYQGLHAIIKKPNGTIFEIQVRTMAMDIIAEYGSAKHELHKNDRYEGEFIDLDFSRVNIPGFTVIDNEVAYDLIGLCKSIDPFNFI